MSVIPWLVAAALAATPAQGEAPMTAAQPQALPGPVQPAPSTGPQPVQPRAPGQTAHDVVLAGRVTAVSGLALTALSIPAFMLTSRCIFREGPSPGLDVCDTSGILAVSGLAATAAGTGMIVGGSLSYLSTARRRGVSQSPAPGLLFLGAGVASISVAALSPRLDLQGAPWSGIGTLSILTGIILLDHAHSRARREVGGPALRLRPLVDPVGRSVGVMGRF